MSMASIILIVLAVLLLILYWIIKPKNVDLLAASIACLVVDALLRNFPR